MKFIAAGSKRLVRDETGDVPGWVLITLMTAGSDLTQKASVSKADEGDELSFATAPNCPTCLFPMEAVVTCWWCDWCRVAIRPGR